MSSAYYLAAAVLLLGLLLLLLETFVGKTDKRLFAFIGMGGLGAVLMASFFLPQSAETALVRLDAFSLFFQRFSLLTTILVLAMSLDYRATLTRFTQPTANSSTAPSQAGLGEFFAIPVFACAGMMWLVSATDFILLFVALELVTISFYVLVSFMRRSSASLEAGVKYLILGALSTGFLVYGITWIFGVTGETNLAKITESISHASGDSSALLFGLLLVGIAVGFKVAAVPFQIWVPDVYQGAPTPVTAFLSVGSKAAGFVVLLRLLALTEGNAVIHAKMIAAYAVLAGLTLIYGNLAAMPQTNLKRLLAYSSIAHAGYLLVGLVSGTSEGVAFYLAAYLLMTLLSFLVLILVANETGGDEIANFNGLAQRSPTLALGMLIAMVSLAGLPFTVGFFGKFLVFAAAVQTHHYGLVALGALSVACGFYYYLKVVRAMYWKSSDSTAPIAVSALTRFAIVSLSVLILVFGIWPQPILGMLR